ncbi:MAG TPA: hypothetical protein P5292_01210 [Bacteroidia bacterium]|jgi:hypothetical protein|nr:hypothetical protein [Bacteroidia bacterium]
MYSRRKKDMDAFEQIIGQLLVEEKYWVRHSVKIDLTPEEKRYINKPSTPRPEIDIVAYNTTTDTIYLLEVKSYLDSPGVVSEHVAIEQDEQSGRYKLLTAMNYRTTLAKRLHADWCKSGHIRKSTRISFGLIAGKVYRNRELELRRYFQKQGWLFWGPSEIKSRILRLSQKGYENNTVTIAAKILTRV